MPLKTQTTFNFNKILNKTVLEFITKLKPKTSHGPDLISNNVLKKIAPTIILPLVHLINLSMSSGFVPSQLKFSTIKPIFKSDDRNTFGNYRPISILSCFSQLLEKIICQQLINYFEINKLFYKHQYGFRANHSTIHALAHFCEKIYSAFNQDKFSIAVFIDLKKAFDTVDSEILLKKLEHYGIKSIELDWFKSYLSNRIQCCQINGHNSLTREVKMGVPQGSVAGPL